MHKLSFVALRKLASRPRVILAGTASVILVILLGITFTSSIEGEGTGTFFTTQATPVYAAIPESQGQVIFEQQCQACHTIGGGRLVGPDLKGVTARRDRDWLVSFITSPGQLIAQGDSLANQLVKEYGMAMPDLGVSEQEAEELLTYIEARSGSEGTPAQAEAPPVLLVGTADAAKGRDIFTGRIPLKNGGAACISCHNVNGIAALGGGAFAKDLTGAYSRLGGAGLTTILKTAPFPMMKTIYGPQPLEDDEVANLVAFLEEIADSQQPASGQSPLVFIVLGIAGLVFIAVILQIIWRGRISGVRQSLVKGGSK